MSRSRPSRSSRRARLARRRLTLRREQMLAGLGGLETLEKRSVMAGDSGADIVGCLVDPPVGDQPQFEQPVVDPEVAPPDTVAFTLGAPAAPAAPTSFKVSWSSDAGPLDPKTQTPLGLSDALSFKFGDTPQPGDTWSVLENGVPIAVNTRYYKGLAEDTWETTIDANPFDFTKPVFVSFDPIKQQAIYRPRESWDLASNPVILPTAYGQRALTAGNKYEIQVTRAGESTTSAVQYGRFRGASASGVNETQTGTVSLLDFDCGGDPPAGVSLVRAMQGEQVAAVVLDAGKKVTLRLGDVGVRSVYGPSLDLVDGTLEVTTNRPEVWKDAISIVRGANPNEWLLTLDSSVLAGKPGLVSVRIGNKNPGTNVTSAPRYLGVIVKDSGGQVPARPEWLAVGAVNTNDEDAQNFFRGTTAGDNTGFKAFDTQYIYLNDGPQYRPQAPVTPTSPLEYNTSAWRTSSGGFDGKKLVQSLREAAKLGSVPQIVYYNIMTPNESQAIALANLQNRPFLVEYFKDLKFTVDTIRRFAGGTTVALILEPDLLAYMMQSCYDSVGKSYRDPSTIVAMTDAAYEAGLLPDPGAGSRLPNTLPGFVEAINRGVRHLSTQTVGNTTESVNLEYGWKFNLWAYQLPAGGSVAKITDVLGWSLGRDTVEQAAKATADWYVKAGILTGDEGKTMDFIALDKYGTDGGATGDDYPQNGTGYTDPSNATFLWNADHWSNYLLYAKTLHDSLGNRPVRLWQLPVGHVNGSDYTVPDGSKAGTRKQVADLANVAKQWEDSAVSYFFGDNFSGLSQGRIDPKAAQAYFAENDAKDSLVSQDGDGTIIWGNHMAAARDAGIESIMFGPGLANSTQGGGYQGPALDGYFWAAKVQDYLKKPLPIPRVVSNPGMKPVLTAQASRTTRLANGSIPSAAVTVTRTGDLSKALALPVKVVGGTAQAGSDFRKLRLEKMRVRFQPGQSSALLVVPTLPTRSAQPQETIALRIGGATRMQPRIRTTVVLGATSVLATSTPSATVAIAGLTNQMRAVETQSHPTNPGRIVAQLRHGAYPNPEATNEVGEVSGTNGLAAYPGDLRNTPGAFQVDLANPGVQDPSNPWMEKFGDWQGVPASLKTGGAGLEINTRIAWSRATLSEFFGIEVDKAGLITRMPAAAAAVFLRNDALADANSDAWNPSANPLIGQHIDNFQREQLSLYLAGRTWSDTSVGVQEDRTAPPPVMKLAEKLQQQVARSFMYGVYQKYRNHAEYKDVFAEAQKMFGATLKITASTSAFGAKKGDEFWCRMNGGFVVAGAYVRGEVEMFNVLKAFVDAAKTGKGTWVVNPEDLSKNVTFTRVTPAGTPAKDAVFTVDKTPLNHAEMYPSIFHYGAVVSAVAENVDWTDKVAWGVKDRNVSAGLGYARLGPGQMAKGTTTITQPGRYMYTGLDDGQTLTLSGAGPFYIYGAPGAGGVTISPSGYNLPENNGGSVAAGQKIDISQFAMTTPQQVLDASFYGWWDGTVTRMAKVNDPAVPANTAMYLYFVPAAGGDPANVLANATTAFYDVNSPYFHSARLLVANTDTLGRAPTAEAWAANFMLQPQPVGTGVIDASAATGNVFIVVDDSVATVKLGSGPTAAIGLLANKGPKTYALDAKPLVGSGYRPFLGLFEKDTIDVRRVSGNPTWTIDNREQATFDNKAAAGTPYAKFAAFSRYFASDASGNRVAEFAGMLRADEVITDPAAVINAGLVTESDGASAAPTLTWSQIREMPFVDMSLYPDDDAKIIDAMRQAMNAGIRYFAISAVNMDAELKPVFLASRWENSEELSGISATSGSRYDAVMKFVREELRPRGGEIIVSFGADAGCNGRNELLEPALRVLRYGQNAGWSESQMVDKLGAFYADVARKYYVDAQGIQRTAFLDMNIEGYADHVDEYSEAKQAAVLRSKALRQTRLFLEDYTYYTNTLEVSATLSAPHGGAPNRPLANVALLANHLGEPVQKINIMAMWLGGEGDILPDIKDRMTKVHEYLPESWTRWDRLGVIVQPGRQNSQFFGRNDMYLLQDWAFTKGLGTVGFWRVNSIPSQESGGDQYDGIQFAGILSEFDGQ